jgi:hypothetical protein
MDVDERILRARHRMLGDLERRRRVVLHERELRGVVGRRGVAEVAGAVWLREKRRGE